MDIKALFLSFFISFFLSHSSHAVNNPTSIVFSTYARANYAFDIFTVPVSPNGQLISTTYQEVQLTDGQSVNYNGFFSGDSLLYVSERNGSPDIYLSPIPTSLLQGSRRSAMNVVPDVLPALLQDAGTVSMKDRPSVAGDRLIYVSTHVPARILRQSWAAVYSTHLKTQETVRLTPDSVADFSPSVSPSGQWTAVASTGERGWSGETEEIGTDIYVFNTSDGSSRYKLVDNGGWPSFSDDSTVYFHRKADDGWWSIFRKVIRRPEDAREERITPPGVHAFTPAASRTGKFVVVATRRLDSAFRHIERFDLESGAFIQVTNEISPQKDHYNPFLSSDSKRIGYHSCPSQPSDRLLLENIRSPIPSISFFRIDGTFVSFSPEGNRLAYVASLESANTTRLSPDEPGVYIVNRDGSGKRRVSDGPSFNTAWDPQRPNVVYTSVGHAFSSNALEPVDVVSVSFSDSDMDPADSRVVTLATGGNNAFPFPSPDGKYVVFRSGRSGHMNLYIMDAIEGEKGGLLRLTEGRWTDTMCVWSPNGEWIAFSSDREEPGSHKFEIYLIHPNGTGLRRLFPDRIGGKACHPWFSPDSASLTFGADYAGVSAEPVSNPQQNMVHGEVFTVRLDGSELNRITHNFYEDGAAAWGPGFLEPVDVVYQDPMESASTCVFDDTIWLEYVNGSNTTRTVSSCRYCNS